MTRNVIIGGVPRSGKTTLCRRIAAEYGRAHISLDSLVKAFEKAFPELGISNDAPEFEQLCLRIKPFLFEHLHWLSNFQIPFVLDAYYIRPQDLHELDVVGGWTAVFLGYPSVSISKRLKLLREREKSFDWTAQFSDEEITLDLQRFSKASERISQWCSTANVPFFDVSTTWSAQQDSAFRVIAAELD